MKHYERPDLNGLKKKFEELDASKALKMNGRTKFFDSINGTTRHSLDDVRIICNLPPFHFIYILAFVLNFNMYGQVTDKDYSFEPDENYIQRETEYEKVWLREKNYVDGDADTLFVSHTRNMVGDGKIYFFRRSPLSMMPGWTNIFTDDEVDFSIFQMFLQDINNNGKKGYTLTWVLKNDSLFIKDITQRLTNIGIAKSGNPLGKEELRHDTIIHRLENFTERKFVNGLMFADWISGELGVITRHTVYPKEFHSNLWEYMESYNGGMILIVERGLIKFIDLDRREYKH